MNAPDCPPVPYPSAVMLIAATIGLAVFVGGLCAWGIVRFVKAWAEKYPTQTQDVIQRGLK